MQRTPSRYAALASWPIAFLALLLPTTASVQEPVTLSSVTTAPVPDVFLTDDRLGVDDSVGHSVAYSNSPTWGTSGDWNFGFANIASGALAQRQIEPLVGSVLPILASAWTGLDCDNPGYRAAYVANPIPFNAVVESNAASAAFARAEYTFEVILAPGAPSAAYETPVLLDVRIVWALENDGTLTAAHALAGFYDFALDFEFRAMLDQQGLQFFHTGVSAAAAAAFGQSGGLLSRFPFGPNAAVRFVVETNPHNRHRVHITAEAAADATARVTNLLQNQAAAIAFINSFIEISAS